MSFFKIILFLILFTAPLTASCPLTEMQGDWAKNTLANMSLEEKVGQLLIVGAYSNREDALSEGQQEHPTEYVEKMIRDYHVGSILFKMRCDPLSQNHLITHFRSLSTLPLLTMQDLEWGLTMRHANGLRFPKNMTLGAIEDDSLIYTLGREIAKQAKLVGIDCNLAPVVDVNSNPKNPIIGDRSFGDNPAVVAKKAVQYMKGLQAEGIIACAKHFPGHGDTDTDSHTSLPQIQKTEEQLAKCELLPFQKMIDSGVLCIMTAHILVPKLDNTPKIPATLSYPIITSLLKKKMGFEGIVITDDLLMKAISNIYSPKEAALMAFQAGSDLIMSSKDIPECFDAIKNAVKNGTIQEKELNARVLKILKLKEWSKINNQPSAVDEKSAIELKKQLYQEAITANNFSAIDCSNAAVLQIGGTTNNSFYTCLKQKSSMPRIYIRSDSTKTERERVLKELQSYSTIIVSFSEMSRKAADQFGIKPSTLELIEQIRMLNKKWVFVLFGSPYALKFFKKEDACLIAYEDDPDAQEAAADTILGILTPKGKLPIAVQ